MLGASQHPKNARRWITIDSAILGNRLFVPLVCPGIGVTLVSKRKTHWGIAGNSANLV